MFGVVIVKPLLQTFHFRCLELDHSIIDTHGMRAGSYVSCCTSLHALRIYD